MTTDGWKPVHRVRNHERVLAQVAERIMDGRLEVGDRLPSERELVSALRVSRTSVREALRILEALGIVKAGTGSGHDAGSIICDQPTDAFATLLTLHMALTRFHLSDLVETRIQLERGASARAASTARPEDVERLRELVADMQRPAIKHATFHELDTEFHVTIASISGNVLTADLMQALRGAVRTHMEAAFASVQDWATTVRQLCSEHGEIVSAIEDRRAADAADLVATHISGFYAKYAGIDLEKPHG